MWLIQISLEYQILYGKVLASKGITNFTPVQGEAFKPVLSGRDVIGRSRTGTGKTLAFGIPSLHRLVALAEEKGLLDSFGRRQKGRNTSMLILCPTRELARQVQEELDDIAKPLGLFTTVFHGGVPYDSQVREKFVSFSYDVVMIINDFIYIGKSFKTRDRCACWNSRSNY